MHLCRLRSSLAIAIGIMLAVPLGSAVAQSDLYRLPGGNIEGNAGTELSQIRRRDIGLGYSVDNVIRTSLNRVSVATPFIGGYTPQTQVGGINRNVGAATGAPRAQPASIGIATGAPASKPFSNASTGPTVSPYLNLFREDLDGFSDFNYQTLVRPQVQQMEINQNLQRQQQEINRKVQSLSARQAYNPQGSEQQLPTGHQTIFNNLSHYYPSAQRRR